MDESSTVEPTSGRRIDVSRYRNPLGARNKLGRLVWGLVWVLLIRASPTWCFAWRRFLLRLFGAQVSRHAYIYPSCRIWAPWNLEIGEYSCLSRNVDCYNVGRVRIGAHVTVSQCSFLCTAGHDIADVHMRLVTSPITLRDGTWICADVYVGPGVTMGDGSVAAARAVVTKDVEPWTVVGGNPARFIKKRELQEIGP